MSNPSPQAVEAAKELHCEQWHGMTYDRMIAATAVIIDQHFLPFANEIVRLNQALSELSADKARLDWLEKKRGDVQFVCGTHFIAGHPGMTRPCGGTVREAIDRAMKQEP
jgi:hypothetical protein